AFLSGIVLIILAVAYFNGAFDAKESTNNVNITPQLIIDENLDKDFNVYMSEEENTLFFAINSNLSENEFVLLLKSSNLSDNHRNKLLSQYQNNLSIDNGVNEDSNSIDEDINDDSSIASYKNISDDNSNQYNSYSQITSRVSVDGSLMSWPENICVERPIYLNAKLDGDYTYKWSSGEITPSINVSQTGIFKVTASSVENPSEIVTKSILVRYIPVPVLNNEYYFNACVGEVVNITVKQGVDAYRYYWPCLDISNPNASITQAGKYRVEIQGCHTYLDSFIVNYTHCDLEIPTMISPNDDGLNDVFYVIHLDRYKNTKLYVYNQDSKLVYQSEDYQNDWSADGLSDGSYYYLLKFMDGISQEGMFNVRRK
ncbi:MAG: gliding motility-associated C-terminal domain-containing protein, partial [Clostridiales bacterium]|nr:gliding motility-associated C-terminal domain-containing protein [Clostridiales bacterium]